MKRVQLLAGLAFVTATCAALAGAEEGKRETGAPASPKAQAPQPEARPIELSGRLARPPKWTPQLELMPAGQIRRIDIQGALLRDIPEGAYLHVRGVARSRLHTGGTADNPSPFPAQWILWLEVTEVKV